MKLHFGESISAYQSAIVGKGADTLSAPPKYVYCFSRKNRLPVGGVMVMLFVPLAGVMT